MEDKEIFKKHDVVQFRAGGPKMMIKEVDDEEPKYHCKWLNSKLELTDGWFHTKHLILSEMEAV